jgi:putative peptidoglycan binding protein
MDGKILIVNPVEALLSNRRERSFRFQIVLQQNETPVPNGQRRATGSGVWVIGIIAAVVVIAVMGWAWNYRGYGWRIWWNQNTSNHAANTRPTSSGPGASYTQEPQNAQQLRDQSSQPQRPLAEESQAEPNNPQGQRSNTNQPKHSPGSTSQSAQEPSNRNQPTQNPSNTNQAAQNRPNNDQSIPSNSLSPDGVREVQQALSKNGFRAGPADGRWGPKTSEALKQFQQSKNLQAAGQLDQQTLSELGVDASSLQPLNSATARHTASPAFARSRARRPARVQRTCGPTGTSRPGTRCR